jgi:hypothetical protein
MRLRRSAGYAGQTSSQQIFAASARARARNLHSKLDDKRASRRERERQEFSCFRSAAGTICCRLLRLRCAQLQPEIERELLL